jgi:hypothetical protein
LGGVVAPIGWNQGGVMSQHIKDVLENTLHKMVCEGTIGLEAAQTAIATDWVAANTQYVGNP